MNILEDLIKSFGSLSNLIKGYRISSLSYDSFDYLIKLVEKFGCYDIVYNKDEDKFEKTNIPFKEFNGQYVLSSIVRKLDEEEKVGILFRIIKIYFKYKCKEIEDLIADYLNDYKIIRSMFFAINRDEKKILLRAIDKFVKIDIHNLSIILDIIAYVYPSDEQLVNKILNKIKKGIETGKIPDSAVYYIHSTIVSNRRKKISKKLMEYLFEFDKIYLKNLIFKFDFYYKVYKKLAKKILDGFISDVYFGNFFTYDHLNNRLEFNEFNIKRIFGIICNDDSFIDEWTILKKEMGEQIKNVLKDAKCFHVVDIFDAFDI